MMEPRVGNTIGIGRALLLAMAVWVMGTAVALAEGSSELGASPGLSATTTGYVDIVLAGETIQWVGTGTMAIRSDTGTLLATLSSGQIFATPSAGVYELTWSADSAAGWDVTVRGLDASVKLGRLHSLSWNLFAPDFATGTSASVFVVVSGGGVNDTEVIEVRLDGFAGFNYSLAANALGVDGARGHSVVESGQSISDPYPIYLNLPATASYSRRSATPLEVAFSGGTTGCNATHTDGSSTFSFRTNAETTYWIMCDLDDDGILSSLEMDDLALSGVAPFGTTQRSWDGRDPFGAAVPPGSYDCQIQLNMAEVHFVANDIETSYQGFRMFGWHNFVPTPLTMYWNDAIVQVNATTMPNGDVSPASSGLAGISSGDPVDPTAPHGIITPGNARAWGDFSAASKGNGALLDTFGYMTSQRSALFAVDVLDETVDSDFDALTDFVERCELGTSPVLDDSDADGVRDYEETSGGSPVDTDGDGTIDALDTDSDGDGVGDDTDLDRTDFNVCADVDSDTCDDCSQGAGADPMNDGTDTDGDGLCDAGDPSPLDAGVDGGAGTDGGFDAGTTADAGATDAGAAMDASASDADVEAGVGDGGAVDMDAARVDASSTDGGAATDSGTGVTDGGAGADGGANTDAGGATDGGAALDAGRGGTGDGGCGCRVAARSTPVAPLGLFLLVASCWALRRRRPAAGRRAR